MAGQILPGWPSFAARNKYFWVLAELVADGEEMNELLLRRGLPNLNDVRLFQLLIQQIFCLHGQVYLFLAVSFDLRRINPH